MGFNSTLVILNDGLHNIEKDENFGKKVSDAILTFDRNDVYRRDISCGGHCNVAQVVNVHHADITSIIAVGGNYGSVMGQTYGISHSSREDQERLVRHLADKLGYDIHKKRRQN